MTLNLELSPEREAALRAQAQARGLSIEQWLVQLGEQSGPAPHTPEDDARPVWEIIAETMKQVPPEEFAKLPRDGASEHDHYLYGHPKRNA
jgi:hypothetical protein